MPQSRTVLVLAAAYVLVCRAEESTGPTEFLSLPFLSSGDSKEGGFKSPAVSKVEDSVGGFDYSQGQQIFSSTFTFLETTPYQWAVALGAFVAGMCMVINGEATFKYVVVLATFLSVGASAYFELNKQWNGDGGIWRAIFAAEVGAIASLIVHEGFEAAQLIMGVALGMALALNVRTGIGGGTLGAPALDTVTFTVCVGIGVYAFMSKQHIKVMNILLAIAGGLMVSSSVGFGIAFFVRQYPKVLESQGFKVDVAGTTFAEFIRALVIPGAAHVGICGAYPSPVINGHTIDPDKALGFALWLFSFYIACGKIRQRKLQKDALGTNPYAKMGRFSDGLNKPLLR